MSVPWLKSAAKRTFRKLGFEISRFTPERSEAARVTAVLEYCGIELVFDVGANVGQYASMIREAGYRHRIVSFEPLSDAHAALTRRARSDPLWSVHPRCAVGNVVAETVINVAGNSLSSSVLAMLPAHSSVAPDSAFVAAEPVQELTLDSVIPLYRRGNETTYLKIDTQGFEKEVLEGAAQSLPFIKAVQIELSLVALYEGQHLWDYFLSLLESRGFVLWSFLPVFTDSRTGRLLQGDAIFCRA